MLEQFTLVLLLKDYGPTHILYSLIVFFFLGQLSGMKKKNKKKTCNNSAILEMGLPRFGVFRSLSGAADMASADSFSPEGQDVLAWPEIEKGGSLKLVLLFW